MAARLQRLRGSRLDDGTVTLGKARLKEIIDYMQANLARSPSVEELANIAQLSRYHFSRAFKHATGLSPHRYLMQLRVEHVCNVLERNNGHSAPLSVLANEAGFADQAHMTRAVKHLTGLTPGHSMA